MALTVAENTDIGDIIRFTPSAAAELLIGLGSVHQPPPRLKAWAAQARAALGPEWLRSAFSAKSSGTAWPLWT